MQPEQSSLVALHSLTSSDPRPATLVNDARPSISTCVDYLIWTIETAAEEQELRNAKSMLEASIESYVDEVTNRMACRDQEETPEAAGADSDGLGRSIDRPE
jgi:hypothetical protein